jgi:glutamate-1-semialdehyde 2,1-aminomutase
VRHADWAILAKNGTDATTMCCTIARAQTGRSKILVAKGAYHGAAPWCTPRPAGVTPADHANLGHYTFNDLASVRQAAAEAGDDLAGILVSPFKHDAGYDQELVDPAFARGLRALCDATGAALILDDVRAGFRLHLGSSWEPVGVDPDLSAWSKAIANGRALAAVLGNDAFRGGAKQVFVTGSFWFSAVPMAAAIATIGALREEKAVEAMHRMGEALRDGILDQARSWDLAVSYTGPPVMPYLTFAGDQDHEIAGVFAAQALRGGAYLHPRHNWFVSAAMTGDDLALALEATDQAFAAVRKHLGQLPGGPEVNARSQTPIVALLVFGVIDLGVMFYGYLQSSAFGTLVGATAIIPYIIYFLITLAYTIKRRTLDSLPGAFNLGRWAWPVIGFVLAYTVVVMLVLSLPAPFHGSDKVLGYGLALAALWYFGGLLWRLKKGTAGIKPVEDPVQGPPQAG